MNDLEDQLRQMIDEIPALACRCLPDGACKFVNKQWLDYTGLSMDAALSSTWKSIVHPDDSENLLETWRDHCASGELIEVETRLKRADGEYRWFLFRAVPLRDGEKNVIEWYGTSTDIQHRKQIEAALRRDKVQLQLIIDTIPQYIIVLEPDGTLKQVNQQVLDYTGLNLHEAECPEPHRSGSGSEPSPAGPDLVRKDDASVVRLPLKQIIHSANGAKGRKQASFSYVAKVPNN